MKIKVDVTQDHITNGKRYSGYYNPIANAFWRMFPNAFRFRVFVSLHNDKQSGTWWSASLCSLKGHISFTLDKDTTAKIITYDQTGVMEPFSFEVEI